MIIFYSFYRIYQEKFNKQTNCISSSLGLSKVLSGILSSGLSDRTKSLLPTKERVIVTIKNSNWLLRYWDCIEPRMNSPINEDNSLKSNDKSNDIWDHSISYPNPVCNEFGFKWSSNKKNPSVQWLDN